MKRTALKQLHRRWRLRAEDPAAYWRIYHFAPSPGDDGISSSIALHPMAELLAKPCLFLLGRPGAGKTAEFQIHLQADNLPDETVIALEARELDGTGAESIFRGAEWSSALAGGKPIRLVLDSVDEALLGHGAFLDRLRRQLGQAKSEAHGNGLALSLVLTCRLAEWSEEVAGEIAELWGLRAEECTYELAPLSMEAALELAGAHGVTDGSGFASAWSHGDMESYACWPRTLIWLAEEFSRDGKISSTLTALHERRCSRQFEDAERSGRLTEKLTPERIARWSEAVELLACAAIATGAQRFVIGRHTGERELDVAAFANALAKLPQASALSIPANAAAFSDALKFGDLFARAGDVWVFQEQSDAEFLAARRLARLPVEQLAGFFGCETRRGWQVFPQLATTAAMAAIHSDEFRQWLLDHDPLVLLRSDFAAISEADRERAVDALLQLIDAGEAPDADDEPAHLHTLRHRKLAAQLRPWLHDSRRKPEAREMALRIAAACADDQLSADLREDIWQLVNSADADSLSWLSLVIRTIGRIWPKERLMRFVNGELSPGRHWECRGAALVALFDEHRPAMPATEQARLHEVAPFFAENPTGVWSSYDTFLRQAHEHLRATDLDDVCGVLAALRRWSAPLDSTSPVEKLTLATLKAAVKLIPNPRATDALASWWIERIQDDDYQLPGRHNACSLAAIGLDDLPKRQALLTAMLRHPSAARLGEVDHHQLPCETEDFPWLLARLPDCTGFEEKLIARLTCGLIRNRARREENRDALNAAYAASAELRALLPAASGGDIHTVLVAVEDENERRWSAKLARRERKQPERDAEKELAATVERCVRGDAEGWPWLLLAAGRIGSSEETRVWNATQPSELGGWTKIPESALEAVSQAARSFLLHHPQELPDRNKSHLGIEAVRHALCLLFHRFSMDAELRAAFRPEWVAIVLRSLYPLKPPLPDVLAALHAIEPRETIECVRLQLEFEWESNRYLLADHLNPLWSPTLAALLVEILNRSPLQPESYRTGLTWLMRRDPSGAEALALRRCTDYANAPPSPERRVAIGTALLAFPECWQQVWPLIAANSSEGIECLSSVGHEFEHLGWRTHMFRAAEKHVEFIATLYGWLLKHLPPEELHRDDSTITGIDYCRDLQRACYNALVDLGRADLLGQAFRFAGIADLPWTHRVGRRSERNAHARAWQPWPPAHFAEWLASDGGMRITDHDALQRAVEASLRRFERRWKGDLPLHYLWDTETPAPLREKKLSDVLKDHLQQDLGRHLVPRQANVSIFREPEFYTGEKSDLFIQSPLPDGSNAIVVVEVKLCDHEQVETSMETQLATRYLRGKNLTHGIYFVGWMSCDDWPKRRKPFQRAGLAKARRELNRQAARLSKDGLNIHAMVCAFPFLKKPRMRRGSKAAS